MITISLIATLAKNANMNVTVTLTPETKCLTGNVMWIMTIGDKSANANYSVDVPPQLTGISDMSSKLAELKNNTVSQNHNVTFGDTNINIDHVQDYEDFVTQLQKDRQFEKMILSMTVDRMTGGSSFEKNKYKW